MAEVSLFAGDQGYRVKGKNPFGLHRYTLEEVEATFTHGFSQVCIDRHITTYQGGKLEQNDWLIIIEK